MTIACGNAVLVGACVCAVIGQNIRDIDAYPGKGGALKAPMYWRPPSPNRTPRESPT